MSRVGKLPVSIPDSVKVNLNSDILEFDSGKVKTTYKISPGVLVEIVDSQIKLSAAPNSASNSCA